MGLPSGRDLQFVPDKKITLKIELMMMMAEGTYGLMWVLKYSWGPSILNTHKILILSALKGGDEGIWIHILHLVGLEPKTRMGPLDHYTNTQLI
jgi:hypothetical protein